MERLKPSLIPAIFPEPEYLVSGKKQIWYQDMKLAYQVPWMGVVTMAFAHYEDFFEVLWSGLQPMTTSVEFDLACDELQELVETQVGSLNPNYLVDELKVHGFGEREIAEIGQLIEIFHRGNLPYFLTATIARRLMEGFELNQNQEFQRRPETKVVSDRLVLIEEHHATSEVLSLYQDIRKTLDLPFVNTDYRALARWPSYFTSAWKDLRPWIQSDEHERICVQLHEVANRLVGSVIPNPERLRRGNFSEAILRNQDILATTRLFQWLLPGLITNVAFFRAQLNTAKHNLF